MNTNLVFLIIFGVLLSAIAIHYTGNRSRDSLEKNSNIRYIKDHKSGLCFAVDEAYQKYGMAHVPCEPVKEFLK